jgi:DNA replication and repair protein RecF
MTQIQPSAVIPEINPINPGDLSGITRLILTNFRSYPSLRLECDARPVVLTGPNGAGKTNILEAVSFLSPGRGLRNAKASEALYYPVKQAGTNGWAVAATLESPEGTTEIGTGIEPTLADSNEKRLLRINREPVKSQAVLTEHLSVLWLTPQMDRIFVEGVTARRKFLDRLVYSFDPHHASRVMRYEHVMRERLRLLKQGGIHHTAWLDPLEQKMAETGVAIAAARLQTLETLKQAKDWALGIFPRAELSMQGSCEQDLQHLSALEAEENLKTALSQSRLKDAESGRTHQGPHRSEMIAIYKDKNQPAEYCSTGEQKALLISIIMAAIRLHALRCSQVPILLLDEIVAHLDEERRQALFKEIISLKVQVWMTGTDAALFENFGSTIQHFKIVEGGLKRL